MVKEKGLGRGLEVLLGSLIETIEAARQEGASTIPKLEQMQPGKYQPRTCMGEGMLRELAANIRTQGLIQPIPMRRVESDGAKPKYKIIVGERRSRAPCPAGPTEVLALVKDVPDEPAAVMALIKNIQCEDLNPLGEAQGVAHLVREFQLTHEQAAESIGRSCSAMSNLLCLLNLAQSAQTMLMVGNLGMGHARALLAVDDATQITLANQVVNKRLSVRETEKLVASTLKPFEPKSLKQKSGHRGGRDMARPEEKLADQLGLGVQIKLAAKGRGQLTMQFNSLNEFDGPLVHLRLDADEEAV